MDETSIDHVSKLPLSRVAHPICPKCQMRMLVTAGFKKDPEKRTYECLRCGYIRKPTDSTTLTSAA
jgi:hypothetical protein